MEKLSKCLEQVRRWSFVQLNFRGLVSILHCILYTYCMYLYCGPEKFFSVVPNINTLIHPIKQWSYALFYTKTKASQPWLCSDQVVDVTCMTGSGLGAEEEGTFRRRLKRLKGRVRGMGRGSPCKLNCLFCKYCLSAITVVSRGLRVGICF